MDLEKLKHKSLMKEFNLYKEMAQKPRARIKEVRVEALREGFKRMIHLKSTEPFASKTRNDLPQKYRMICLKNAELLARSEMFLYLCTV